MLAFTLFVLVGCSTTNKITTAGEKVRFVNAQPGSGTKQYFNSHVVPHLLLAIY
ncbi:hypothetical protein [Arsenophonus endosymbiont of Aleurodicus floccissimus]|uniref:hypothetical protein n=1 Tax=Arsenophonus endosymbiont of Aleurodicus floccissimus TaxID=2152761 RepID=UPI003F724F84